MPAGQVAAMWYLLAASIPAVSAKQSPVDPTSTGFVQTAECTGAGVGVGVGVAIAGAVPVGVGSTFAGGAASDPCGGIELVVEPHAVITSEVATTAS